MSEFFRHAPNQRSAVAKAVAICGGDNGGDNGGDRARASVGRNTVVLEDIPAQAHTHGHRHAS
jgi:hypothetical protein